MRTAVFVHQHVVPPQLCILQGASWPALHSLTKALLHCMLNSFVQLLHNPAETSTLRQRCRGSQRYSVILSTLMQPIVLTASALIRGLGS